jgi:hypothetical protein
MFLVWDIEDKGAQFAEVILGIFPFKSGSHFANHINVEKTLFGKSRELFFIPIHIY